MIWCEISLECQLECVHCYASAGPGRGHGNMSASEWEDVIRQAASLGAGQVIFIGGEPTLNSDLPRLVRAALGCGLTAEIYTNLVRVTPELWELFSAEGVSLATSWYSSDRREHAAITKRDTWRQTRANIAEAVGRGIRIRAGVVTGILPGQLSGDGERELLSLGVTSTGRDVLRQFGRGTVADPSQACGSCGRGILAVLPDGSVTPCPMTRWLKAGNVRDGGLGAALDALPAVAAVVPVRYGDGCDPDPCDPDGACAPNDNCRPNVFCTPMCSPSLCRPNIQ